MRLIIISALSLAAAVAMPGSAQGQYRHGYYPAQDQREISKVEREFRKKFAEERWECSKKQREADSRGALRKAQRECRTKLAEVEHEYRKKLRDANRKAYDGQGYGYDRDREDD